MTSLFSSNSDETRSLEYVPRLENLHEKIMYCRVYGVRFLVSKALFALWAGIRLSFSLVRVKPTLDTHTCLFVCVYKVERQNMPRTTAAMRDTHRLRSQLLMNMTPYHSLKLDEQERQTMMWLLTWSFGLRH